MPISETDYEIQIDVLKRRNAELEVALKKAEARADHERAGRMIATAAAAAGVLPKGIPDIVGRAMNAGQWKPNKHGHLTRHNADGFEEVIGTASGIASVTPEMAVEALRQPADHCWPEGEALKPAQTAPQTPATKAPEVADNPWLVGRENITRQSQILSSSPDLAKKLAAEAGANVNSLGFSRAGKGR